MKIVQIDHGHETGFRDAQDLARTEAGKFLTEPMALSWLNRETGQHSPSVECCGNDNKEAWEIYAESRGATLRVEIGVKYVFLFREAGVAL